MKSAIYTTLLIAGLATACGGDDPAGADAGTSADARTDDPDTGLATCNVTPGPWSAPAFDTNAAVGLALRAQLDTLTGNVTMRGAETETVIVDEVSDLTTPYQAGSPSLASLVAPELDAIIDDVFADFVALVLAGPRDLVDENGEWEPGASGGLYGSSPRGINPGGLEVRQLVDKGLFSGGALYKYALDLTAGAITDATIDDIAAAWGSDAALDFENRTDSANYSYSMGFHAAIVQSLTDAKAYAGDTSCAAERDAALVALFRAWERAMVARTLYYANAASSGFASATTDDEIADALHQLSEGLGLTLGFYHLPHPTSGPLSGAGRVMTDADIEAMLMALGVDLDDLSASTTGAYVEDPTGFATGVTTVESRAMTVFGFEPSDIAAFRAPTAG